MPKITYANKQTPVNPENPSIPTEVFRAVDANEVKQAVNYLYDNPVTFKDGYSTKDFININFSTKGVIIEPSGSQGNNVGLGMEVVYDKKRSLYVMLYAGWNGTGTDEETGGHDIWAATSTDLMTWTKVSDTVPVIPRGVNGSSDFAGGTFPQLYYDEVNDLWNMFYIAFSVSGFEKGSAKIMRATSNDILGIWTKTPTPVLQAPNGWLQPNENIYRPCVVKHNNLYYMFFNGGAYGDERFGYATSTDLGGTWVVSNEPIIPAGIKAAPWCSDDFFSDPQVFFREGKWYCAFWGRYNGVAKLGLLYTTEEDFPLNWRSYSSYVELGAGTQQRPVFVRHNGDTYIFYNTGNLGNLKINVGSTANIISNVGTINPQYFSSYGNIVDEDYAYISRISQTNYTYNSAGADRKLLMSDFEGITNWNQLSLRVDLGFRFKGGDGSFRVRAGDSVIFEGASTGEYTPFTNTGQLPSSNSSTLTLTIQTKSNSGSNNVWLLFFNYKVFKP